MTRIRDLSTFSMVREAGMAKLLPFRPRIAVGMGTCGAGNGSEGVFHAFADADRRIEGFALPVDEAAARYVVVSTQGRGDEAALAAALAADIDYIAFVGSRKKAAALKAALAERGVAAERLAKLKAPAGLDLGAITPEEIAISVLAEIVAVRRGKLRSTSSADHGAK